MAITDGCWSAIRLGMQGLEVDEKDFGETFGMSGDQLMSMVFHEDGTAFLMVNGTACVGT